MNANTKLSLSTVPRDLISGTVVFLVALPLCLGVALASGAPLFSGLVAGVVGGIIVGSLSGSQTSVSGPAAGLTAIVAAQIATLGSFDAFLLAVVVGGALQIALGLARAGALSAFFPSSVIKGLLAAIGVILILKQIPHIFGHDSDPEGEMAFQQPDEHNTFTEIFTLFQGEIHLGATVIGVLGVALLMLWDKWKPLKRSGVPGPLVVVLLGVAIHTLFQRIGGPWLIQESHLVQVPIAGSPSEFLGFLRFPDFSQWLNPAIYVAGITIAVVASLETLLNLEAVDKIDPKQRYSPPSRELLAQGVGNITAGMLGGIPVTSVIVRSSVNVGSGGQTKLSTITHGALIVGCVMFLPVYLNMIPLAALAAILLVTGFKLASPALFQQMWQGGRYQFLPFIITLLAIVFTDLLIGIVIGLIVTTLFILNSNLRRPIRRVVETHAGGDVLHIELANQVSFLNRAALDKVLRDAPRGAHVLLDATHTDYIDPDVLMLICDFKNQTAPAHGVEVSLRGFRDKYSLKDEMRFVDYTTCEVQGQLTPRQVVRVLQEGNDRFRTGNRLSRDFGRQFNWAAQGQHPLAVVLSCIDSRAPAELVFDLGLGDVFSVRVAGNVTSDKVLGSMEYGTAVAGAKLILVMGHTRCGAVTASVDLLSSEKDATQATGCHHLGGIVYEIQQSADLPGFRTLGNLTAEAKQSFIDDVSRQNVLRTVNRIVEQSPTIAALVQQNRVAIVGALYDVTSGEIDFMLDQALGLEEPASMNGAAEQYVESVGTR